MTNSGNPAPPREHSDESASRGSENVQDRRVAEAQAARQRAEVHAISIMQRHQIDVDANKSGVRDLVIPPDTVDRIVEAIDRELRGDARRWARNYVAGFFDRGRSALGWSVNVPPRVLRLRLPPPPLNVRTLPKLRVAKELRRAFVDALSDPPEATSADSGLFTLLSAILFSGLLDPADLDAFARSAHDGLRIRGTLAWVEWLDAGGSWRRVFLDPITLTLLLRWRVANASGSGGASSLVEWGSGERVFDNPSLVRTRELLNAAGIQLPRSRAIRTAAGRWAVFVEPAAVWWSLHMPGALLDWARGRLSSTVLPPSVWERILADRPIEHVEPSGESSEQTRRRRILTGDVDAWWTRLRSALVARNTAVTRKGARVNLGRLLEQPELNALQRELCRWMLQAIARRKNGGQNIGVSSAALWLSTIDRRLYAALGSAPDFGMDPQDLDAVMMQVAQDVPAPSRAIAASALNSFRVYLKHDRGVVPPAVDFSDGATKNVDANLLSLNEVHRIRRVLLDSTRTASWVAACLSLHARLRRSELLELRLSDLIGGSEITLFIRARAPKKLKSASAQRRVVLAPLLDAADRELLEHYRTEVAAACRRAKVPQDEVHLFPSDRDLTQPAKEKDLIDPIVVAMHQVTGDRAMRFHHLRHTGVNRLVLSSMEHLGASALMHPVIKGDPQALWDSRAVIESLVGATLPQRPRLWGVAITTGHATPETTLGSYTHVCDWLRHHATLPALPKLNDDALAKLNGVTVSNLRVRRLRYPDAHPAAPRQLQRRLAQIAPSHLGDRGRAMLRDRLTEQGLIDLVKDLTREDDAVWGRLSLLKSAMPKSSESRNVRAKWVASPSRLLALALDVADVDRWLDAAHKLAHKDSSKRRSSGKVRSLETAVQIGSFQVPGVPRGRGEREQAMALRESLRDCRTRDPIVFEAWLTTYLMHRDADSHAVYLSKPEHAEAWLDQLMLVVQAANQRIADSAWSINVRVEESTMLAGGQTTDGPRSLLTALVPGHDLHGGRTPTVLEKPRYELGPLVLAIEPIATMPRKSRAGAAMPQRWKRTGSAALTIAVYMMLVFDSLDDVTAHRC